MTDFSDAQFYRYHNLTKHTIESLTSGGYFLDWANQPDPFRTYMGSKELSLPSGMDIHIGSLSYFDLLQRMSGQDSDQTSMLSSVEADDRFLSSLLFYSLAISAWKQVVGTDNRWALRVNASSGNLHPTEAHVLVDRIAGFEPGLYHYRAKDHSLEQRSIGQQARLIWHLLGGAENDCPPVLICLTSIHWREVWKYRMRGFRYCQHDMGHALASVIMSAGSLGWSTEIFTLFPDQTVAQLLHMEEGAEKPYAFVALRPKTVSLFRSIAEDRSHIGEKELLEESLHLVQTDQYGHPNTLSPEEIEYEEIDKTYDATCYSWNEWRTRLAQLKTAQSVSRSRLLPFNRNRVQSQVAIHFSSDHVASVNEPAQRIFRRRRSALAMEFGRTMLKEDLAAILVAATRGFSADFQQAISCSPMDKTDLNNVNLIHLFLYIHKVDGLSPGMYYFNRFTQSLLLLSEGNQRQIARQTSCFQEIASDSCLALSMVADMQTAYAWYGDRGYRLMHYEAGFIGQHLYLSSTALGYDSTGIGCFVDDAINRYLELTPGFEVMYNFTIGQSIADPRLTSLPAYDFPDPTVA